jgi:hypothetical protein
VLEPVELGGFGEDVDAAYTAIVARMQSALDQLAAARRLPVVG